MKFVVKGQVVYSSRTGRRRSQIGQSYLLIPFAEIDAVEELHVYLLETLVHLVSIEYELFCPVHKKDRCRIKTHRGCSGVVNSDSVCMIHCSDQIDDQVENSIYTICTSCISCAGNLQNFVNRRNSSDDDIFLSFKLGTIPADGRLTSFPGGVRATVIFSGGC